MNAPFNPDHSFRGFDRALDDTRPQGFRPRDLPLDECRAMAEPVSVGPFMQRTEEDMTDALYRMFGPLRKVPAVRQPNDRLHELVMKPDPLTADESAELTAFEREAG